MTRCEKTDLLVEQCAHCRSGDTVVRQHGTPEAVTRPLGATQARYEGWCGQCRQKIHPGRTITPVEVRASNGGVRTRWICEDCATGE